MASTKALQAAKAVNSLIHLSSRDQDSLIAVIEDYFITPGYQTDDSDTDEDSDSDTQESDVEPGISITPTQNKIIASNHNNISIIHCII